MGESIKLSDVLRVIDPDQDIRLTMHVEFEDREPEDRVILARKNALIEMLDRTILDLENVIVRRGELVLEIEI